MRLILRQIYRRHLLGLLFLTSLILNLGLGHFAFPPQGNGQIATAQPTNANQLVQQGVDRYQAGDFKSAIESWQIALTTYQTNNDRPNTAIILENLARAYQQLGQLDQALDAWQQVASLYRQLGDTQKVGRILTETAQTHHKLGQHRRAIALLCNPRTENNEVKQPLQCQEQSALGIAQRQGDRPGEITALGSLGNAYQAQGEYDQAMAWLEQGLAMIEGTDNSSYQANLLNSLGNTYASRAQLNRIRANFRNNILVQSQPQNVQSLTISVFKKVNAQHRSSLDSAKFSRKSVFSTS